MRFQDLIDALIFQAQVQAKFGQGGMEVSPGAGMQSQGIFQSDSGNDPFGQSFYDQGQGGGDAHSIIRNALARNPGYSPFSRNMLAQNRPQMPLSI